uniref:Uncharacterized protein n=1 Tax=Anguilla anguilla TaxID=7936 RepID=A0A0E9Y078_ANGAN
MCKWTKIAFAYQLTGSLGKQISPGVCLVNGYGQHRDTMSFPLETLLGITDQKVLVETCADLCLLGQYNHFSTPCSRGVSFFPVINVRLTSKRNSSHHTHCTLSLYLYS